jgi:ABC-2 type transport system permease protein
MSTGADTQSPSMTRVAAPAQARPRPYLWSLRRELWEHRSVWIAPLAAAGFVLFGFTISLFRMPHTLQKISKMPIEAQQAIHLIPFAIAAGAVGVTTIIVAVFYCLGTLYNERRDRSILFWKSMPVSDLTTLLSKATVPMIVLPLVAFVVMCVTQLIMVLLTDAALAAFGIDSSTWMHPPVLRVWYLLVYGIAMGALWYAPIYGWLLVISAWAKKAPFLWAVLPPLAIIVVEKLAFDTNHFGDLVNYRIGGWVHDAFTGLPQHGHHLRSFQWPEPAPAQFFSSPGLWIGLAFAAAFFALAVWLRRRREPM